MKQRLFFLILAVSLIMLNSSLIFAQDAAKEPETIAPSGETETQWLWGEVASLDSQKGQIVVKYLDYETDDEKEATIKTNEKTAYENVKSVSEIKPLDTLSIDYVIDPDGTYTAKNISVEKPEGVAAPQEAAPESPTQNQAN